VVAFFISNYFIKLNFEITILGCGSALPVVHRNPTAQLISIANKNYLVDCGEGTQLALRNNHAKLQKMSAIFISHLHGDHYLGLMGLVSSLNLLGRTNPLTIIGPPQLEKILQLHFSVSKAKVQFELTFLPTKDDKDYLVFEDKSISVYSFPLRHRVPCTGFKFIEKQKKANIIKSKIAFYNIPVKQIKQIKAGADFIDNEGKVIPNKNLVIPAPKPRSYAFCSDTIYEPNIVNYIKEVDLLYHESTFLEDLKDRAIKTFHSTAKDAATIAKDAKVGRLILGHYSARYTNTDGFLEEAVSVFENTELAEDSKVFFIDNQLI
jgi:ribonuclease Z